MQNEPTDEIEITIAPAQSKSVEALEPMQVQTEVEGNGRFAVMAPYWVNGLHNFEGLDLADKVNKLVKESGLEEEEEKIAALLFTFSDARRLGLGVVPEWQYLDDHWRKTDPSRPKNLLGTSLVRDKEGAYRPSVGGPPVLFDKGDSLKLTRDKDSLSAAVELAKSKGWTAISLTGKPRQIEAAWVEACVAGIQVTNFTPTPAAQAALAKRLAKEKCAKAGSFNGKIVDVVDGVVTQKVGRDPDVVERHDVDRLTRVPAKGEVVDIRYKDGKGVVSEKAVEKAVAGVGR